MTGRFLARLLAPLALVACAVALFSIVTSGTEDASDGTGDAPAATATPEPESDAKPRKRASGGTYTVKPGDTPSSIAEAEGVDLDELLAANPDVDPNALTVGAELKVP